MAKRTDLEYNVRWLPFQLNANAALQSNKLEMYMKKFGINKEQCMQQSEKMRGNFSAVGLPYNFRETDLTGNTFDAHRVLTAAYEKGGPEAQDKACEKLFHAYFVDGHAPSDPVVLKAAADAAGVGDFDVSTAVKETKDEMQLGRRMGVTGVPHFVIYEEGSSSKAQLNGAQPPEAFLKTFSRANSSDSSASKCSIA